ncbi:hypothetical protein EDC39_102250 [Geothermobacter ehrlichii]|uniref:Lipoic acid-binding regulatory protein n=1 Tax=Geothermobacter ehrlichii TaxID=213224 RepID=A0A5D3WL47_9BACT|nr:DUF493 domain-containing protein [Geothermobacter ehrlichii]TYO99724.1 hypothetical protein EDC39_102250 [Geothermobacter ehrlichii]
MADGRRPEELLVFPCDYQFKVFTDRADVGVFRRTMIERARGVVGGSRLSVSERKSSRGRYTCFTMTVAVASRQQVDGVYQALRCLEGVCYLL